MLVYPFCCHVAYTKTFFFSYLLASLVWFVNILMAYDMNYMVHNTI